MTSICRLRHGLIASGLTIGLAVHVSVAQAPPDAQQRMSFHNRLLLNRAAVNRLETVEVMFAAKHGQFAQATSAVERGHGQIRRSDGAVGYLRAELPIGSVIDVASDDSIEAYQISSLSRAAWYRDGTPQSNAEMFRALEVSPPRPNKSPSQNVGVPPLTLEQSRQGGYTADEDAGVREWFAKHPTFDGRGVTIAILETATAEFSHAILRRAKAIDGREVPKLTGILNTIDPDAPDETRVDLSTEIRPTSGWVSVGNRTYIVPRPGTYRFGQFILPADANLVHQFAVLEDQATQDIWVDANGNADFTDEMPVPDVNDRVDVRMLKLRSPRDTEVSFVVGRGQRPHTVHLYLGIGSHQTMTLSVAAGSKTNDSLAFGVAPNARVLLVRVSTTAFRLSDVLEGYLGAAKRRDVDVLADAHGITMAPDTLGDFVGVLLRRIVAAYGKPVFHSAGNSQLRLSSVSALGDVFSVGGSIGPQTFAALYGGASLADLMVHSGGAAGPGLDGAIKPDFLAPMHRIAADLLGTDQGLVLPKNAAAYRLPPGHNISCCTSASAPYAAGVAALLLSAAKQEHVPYSVETLGRALKIGARFLADWPSSEQGHGVLDVNAAWSHLRLGTAPRISSTSTVVHTLATYAARGNEGQGLYEREGWHVGMTAQRTITFERESGPAGPVTYRLSWTGNDGTFTAPQALSLPLKGKTAIPVTITARAIGVHSAILNLHDPATDIIVFRTQAAIVVSERFGDPSAPLLLTGRIPVMRSYTHYVEVPESVAALSIELQVIRGALRASILPSHGLFPSYLQHVHPSNVRSFAKGRYNIVLPRPAKGIWSIGLANDSLRREANTALVAAAEAEYTVTLRLLHMPVRVTASNADSLVVDVETRATTPREPVLQVSAATLRSHRATTLASGMPNQFEIDVPANATTLALALQATDAQGTALELYLYNCTSGECFSHNFTLPAVKEQTFVIRRPTAGRWIAAVNAAPFPRQPIAFTLDEIISIAQLSHSSPANLRRVSRARWRETISTEHVPSADFGGARVLYLEVIDLASERDETDHPWESRSGVATLPDRPVALGTAVYRVR